MATALLAILPTSLVATTARADDRLRLAWHAPAACPSAETVEAAALRGAAGASVAIEADAKVERHARWKVTLRTRRGETEGERTLEADSCAALADATAIILALALVPPGTAAAEPPSPPPTAPSPAAAPSPPPAPLSAVDAREPGAPPAERPAPRGSTSRSTSGPNVAIGVWGAGDATTLPSPALGGGGSLAWTPGALRIEAGATAWTSQSRTLPESTAGARFAMTTFGAGACHAVLRSDLELSPCAGASLYLVSASGFGATDNYDRSAAWASIDGGLLARVPLASWIALRARADAIVPLARPTFAVENEGVVHRPPPLGLRGSLGAEITIL